MVLTAGCTSLFGSDTESEEKILQTEWLTPQLQADQANRLRIEVLNTDNETQNITLKIGLSKAKFQEHVTTEINGENTAEHTLQNIDPGEIGSEVVEVNVNAQSESPTYTFIIEVYWNGDLQAHENIEAQFPT